MGRPTVRLDMSEADFKELTKFVNAHSTPQRTVIRCKVALMAREGLRGEDIAQWKEHGLKPHLVSTFKVSNDKNFESKLADVVGLFSFTVSRTSNHDEHLPSCNGLLRRSLPSSPIAWLTFYQTSFILITQARSLHPCL
jgi:hypothetical protein